MWLIHEPENLPGLLFRFLYDGYHARVAIHPNNIAGFDHRGGYAGAGYRGDAILAADDGGMTGESSDIGDGGFDVSEHRCPGWVGGRANQNFSRLKVDDIFEQF